MDAPFEPDLARGPYRPAPEAPSKRWGRAALGLRVAAWGTLASVVASEVADAVVHLWAMGRWSSPGGGADTTLRMARATGVFHALTVLGALTTLAGLAAFAQVPRQCGARRSAQVAVGLGIASGLVAYGVRPFLVLLLHEGGVPLARIEAYALLVAVLGEGLEIALVLTMLHALERVHRGFAAAWPGWVAPFTAALVAWHAARVLVGPALVRLVFHAPSLLGWVILVGGVSVNLALAWPLLMLLRRTADVLARQDAPESALLR